MGESAGGHLASFLALKGLDTVSIRGFIGFAAVYDLQSLAKFPIVNFILQNLIFKNHSLLEASPIHHVTKDSPPFLMINGNSDWGELYKQTIAMKEKLEECHVDAVSYTIKGHHLMVRQFGNAKSDLERRVLQFLNSEISKS